MKSLAHLLFLFLLTVDSQGAVYTIGAGETYETPNALYLASVLNDGDEINIKGETFIGQDALAVWNKNNLIIKGIKGETKLLANGQYILGKGIWVSSGSNITIEGIEFADAVVPDHNGAGIRVDGSGLTLRHCSLRNNENGILSNNNPGTIKIEYCEFAYNGYGDGFTHNLYVNHVDTLIFRFNYSHHANIGHCLKSRASNNIIEYNRIMDEESGNSSRLIDISNGGYTVVRGNLLMQGANAENNNFIGYGLEGLSNDAPHDLLVLNNTAINRRQASCIFVKSNANSNEVHLVNNLLGGVCQLVDGPITASLNNIEMENIEDLLLEDEANYNYSPKMNSPAIDAGLSLTSYLGVDLNPSFYYMHPTSSQERSISNDLDVGAYEFAASVTVVEFYSTPNLIYPNPATNLINFKAFQVGASYTIFTAEGLLIQEGTLNQSSLDISNLPNGIYILELEKDSETEIFQFLKH